MDQHSREDAISAHRNAVASERQPLCRLAVNADSKGIIGRNRLIAATVLCIVFMVGEVVGGLYAHSLAVLTDAAHMLSDVLAFIITLGAGWFALRKSTASHTFGYHRAEVLGSLASIAIIWVVTAILVYEAVQRIINPEKVDGKLMFIVAVVGIAVNFVNLFILGGLGHGHSHSHGHGDQEGEGEDPSSDTAADTEASMHGVQGQTQGSHAAGGMSLGLRSAVIHVLGDTVQSFGVVIAAIVIWVRPDLHIVDPICTFVFAVAVMLTTRSMVCDIIDIIMERVPRGFDLPGFISAISGVTGVASLHDLHVWAIKPGVLIAAAHIDILPGHTAATVLQAVSAVCKTKHVDHTTIQLSLQGEPCPCSPIKRNILSGGVQGEV